MKSSKRVSGVYLNPVKIRVYSTLMSYSGFDEARAHSVDIAEACGIPVKAMGGYLTQASTNGKIMREMLKKGFTVGQFPAWFARPAEAEDATQETSKPAYGREMPTPHDAQETRGMVKPPRTIWDSDVAFTEPTKNYRVEYATPPPEPSPIEIAIRRFGEENERMLLEDMQRRAEERELRRREREQARLISQGESTENQNASTNQIMQILMVNMIKEDRERAKRIKDAREFMAAIKEIGNKLEAEKIRKDEERRAAQKIIAQDPSTSPWPDFAKKFQEIKAQQEETMRRNMKALIAVGSELKQKRRRLIEEYRAERDRMMDDFYRINGLKRPDS